MPITANDVNTPAKFAELCEEVKLGILEILNAELVPATVVAGEKIPRIRNRRIIEVDGNTWASRLKSNRHLEGTGSDAVEKVHCYLVGYAGVSSQTDDNTVSRHSFKLTFLIDSYYEDEIGTDADNVEKRHAVEVAKIAYALWASRVLRRPGIIKRVSDFTERRGFARMGDNVVRESLAELTVELQPVPLIKPA